MRCLAIDIGAESGRGIVGEIVDGRMVIDEVHRFANVPLTIDGSLRWDINRLLADVRLAIEKSGEIDSVGIDTWGVDFAFLDEAGELIELPFHYRDRRTDGAMDRVFDVVSRERIYAGTGIQFMPFNSLFQLWAMHESGSESLERARTFLMMPDYLNYELTGRKSEKCEFTNATTTQCFDPKTRSWNVELLQELGIPERIFPEVIEPGTDLGAVDGTKIRVIAPATHDSGSAVAAVPFSDENTVWISSGTWSIVGVNVAEPIVSSESLMSNFTNEGGIDGGFRFCKNVMGLWLVQQCKLAWEADGLMLNYGELVDQAALAQPFVACFDPDLPELLAPGNMPSRIAEILKQSGQYVPEEPAQLIRVILESLAMKYRVVLGSLREVSGVLGEKICIVGGGSQNKLLNQLTADVCGLTVFAGPVEATAIGNLMMQMITLGEIEDVAAGRQLIQESFASTVYVPNVSEQTQKQFQFFKELIKA